MKEWYASLKEVKKALDEGKLEGACMHLWKNDAMLCKKNGESVFIGNDQETLREALDLLGIPCKFE